MTDHEYIIAISKYYMCDYSIAKKIFESAKLNGNNRELDNIVENIKNQKG